MLRRQVRLFTGAFLGQGSLLPGIVPDRPPCRFHWCSSWRRRSSSSLSWCKVRSPWSRLFQQTTEIFPLQYIDEVIDALVVVATVFLPMMLMILRGTALCRRREIHYQFLPLSRRCWCVAMSSGVYVFLPMMLTILRGTALCRRREIHCQLLPVSRGRWVCMHAELLVQQQ